MSAVYVASKFSNKVAARTLMDELEKRGHRITYDWTQAGAASNAGVRKLREVAMDEVQGVRTADMYVLLLPGYFGAHTELGVALASAVHEIYIVGDLVDDRGLVCPFYFHKEVNERFNNMDDFLRYLDIARPAKLNRISG